MNISTASTPNASPSIKAPTVIRPGTHLISLSSPLAINERAVCAALLRSGWRRIVTQTVSAREIQILGIVERPISISDTSKVHWSRPIAIALDPFAPLATTPKAVAFDPGRRYDLRVFVRARSQPTTGDVLQSLNSMRFIPSFVIPIGEIELEGTVAYLARCRYEGGRSFRTLADEAYVDIACPIDIDESRQTEMRVEVES